MEGKDLIINEFLQGASAQQLADKYGVTREAIYLRLRTLPNWREVSKKMKRQRDKERLDKQKKHILELAEQGYSADKISKELRLANKTVTNVLRGTKYDRTFETLRHRNAEAKKLRALGWSKEKLCERYGVKPRQLHNMLSK